MFEIYLRTNNMPNSVEELRNDAGIALQEEQQAFEKGGHRRSTRLVTS